MPIGDLLAEISGGQSSTAPAAKTPTTSGIKRKAEGDSNGVTSTKLIKARQQDGSYSSTKVAQSSPLPHRTHSPSTNGQRYQPPVPTTQRKPPNSSNGRPTPVSAPRSSQANSSTNATSRPKLSSSALSTSKVSMANPSPTTPTASDPSRPHKRGSYAEVMARAKLASEKMGKVGMIQHKAIDKPMNKKEREVVKPGQKPGAKAPTTKPYLGNGRPSATSLRDAKRPGGLARDAPRNGSANDAKTANRQRPGSAGGDAQEKKVKKSATATTGYTGTARPRPGATSQKASASRKEPPSKPARSGGLLAPPKPSRRDRYEEEYDDELDDFIEYDDEDEPDPRGHGYGYASDGSSDMEAGMSDIATEERRAEHYAKEEDRREQALEEKLRREKEARKRQSGRGMR